MEGKNVESLHLLSDKKKSSGLGFAATVFLLAGELIGTGIVTLPFSMVTSVIPYQFEPLLQTGTAATHAVECLSLERMAEGNVRLVGWIATYFGQQNTPVTTVPWLPSLHWVWGT
ncbi:hypothetical protein GQR58_027286 [Nymphon striatum]|nr:hypothetical protein GQR58_027286 [Nymphon striatum]